MISAPRTRSFGIVLTWCLLAGAAACRDGVQAGRGGRSRTVTTLDPCRLVAGARPGLRKRGDPAVIWGNQCPSANTTPLLDAAFTRSPAPPTA